MRYKTEKEEHYVLTSEPDGSYLTHLTPNRCDAYGISSCIVVSHQNKPFHSIFFKTFVQTNTVIEIASECNC